MIDLSYNNKIMKLISAAAALLLANMGVDAKHPQIYYQLSTTTENLLSNEFAYLDHHVTPPHHWGNQAEESSFGY